tara:strand:+ start:4783 stop:7236 length:2454 start_codon:yes stop_codon:yes gene_type:complete
MNNDIEFVSYNNDIEIHELGQNFLNYVLTENNDFTTLKQFNGYTIPIFVKIKDLGGFGDIIFGCNFAKYILQSFPNVHITIIYQKYLKNHLKFITNYLQKYIEYIDDRETGVQFGDVNTYGNRGKISICQLSIANHIFNPKFTYYDSFTAPDTGNKILVRFDNSVNSTNTLKKLRIHTFCFSEYSPVYEGNYTQSSLLQGNKIKTGIPSAIDPNFTGIMLNTYDKIYDIPKNLSFLLGDYRFSLTYLYTQNADVNVCKLIPCFFNYMNELEKIRKPNEIISILLRGESIHERYGNSLKGFYTKLTHLNNHTDANTQVLINYLLPLFKNRFSKPPGNPNDGGGYRLIDLCLPIDKLEMTGLFQRSLPVAFLSGDQTLGDLLSTHEEFGNSWYQVLGWKKIFAKQLNNNYTNEECIVIKKENMDELKSNPIYDFRYTGMEIIGRLIKSSLQDNLNPTSALTAYSQVLTNVNQPSLYKNFINKTFSIIFNVTEQQNGGLVGMSYSANEVNFLPWFIPYAVGSSNNLFNWVLGTEYPKIFLLPLPYYGISTTNVQTIGEINYEVSAIFEVHNSGNYKIMDNCIIQNLVAKQLTNDLSNQNKYSYFSYMYTSIINPQSDTVSCFMEAFPKSKDLESFSQSNSVTVRNCIEIFYQMLDIVNLIKSNTEIKVLNCFNAKNIFVEELIKHTDVTSLSGITYQPSVIIRTNDYSNAILRSNSGILWTSIKNYSAESSTVPSDSDDHDSQSVGMLMQMYFKNDNLNMWKEIYESVQDFGDLFNKVQRAVQFLSKSSEIGNDFINYDKEYIKSLLTNQFYENYPNWNN